MICGCHWRFVLPPHAPLHNPDYFKLISIPAFSFPIHLLLDRTARIYLLRVVDTKALLGETVAAHSVANPELVTHTTFNRFRQQWSTFLNCELNHSVAFSFV